MDLLPTRRAQGSGRELKMLASPWSPPAWMKDQSWNPGAPATQLWMGCAKARVKITKAKQ